MRLGMIGFGSFFIGPGSLSGASVRYAEHFSIEREAEFFRLKVRASPDLESDAKVEWLIVPKLYPGEVPIEEGVEVLKVPIDRAVYLSTTYLGAIELLGLAEMVVGVDAPERVSSPRLRSRIEKKAIVGVGQGGVLDVEGILGLRPQIVVTSVFEGGSQGGLDQLRRLGVPLLYTSAYLEAHPLGRAEWIKVFGLLHGELEAAEAAFSEVEQRYESLRLKVLELGEDRPTVLTGAPWGGVWFCAGGASYLATLIRDAGGIYLWEDSSKASIPRDLETVLRKAWEVDFWINLGDVQSLAGLLGGDRRLRLVGAVSRGRLYNDDAGWTDRNRGNPIYERGVVRPDEVLADLISIFHPELIPEAERIYYRLLD